MGPSGAAVQGFRHRHQSWESVVLVTDTQPLVREQFDHQRSAIERLGQRVLELQRIPCRRGDTGVVVSTDATTLPTAPGGTAGDVASALLTSPTVRRTPQAPREYSSSGLGVSAHIGLL